MRPAEETINALQVCALLTDYLIRTQADELRDLETLKAKLAQALAALKGGRK